MRLYLIRHGQSTNNALGHLSEQEIQLQRSHDPHLTEIGVQQAQRVADFLASGIDMPLPSLDHFAFTHLYVSPMLRALQTAAPIATALNMSPEVWVDIHEVGGLFKADADHQITGFPGLTRLQMIEQFPTYQLTDSISDQGWWDATRGRETPERFLARAIGVAIHLRNRAETRERIVLVAHAAFLDALIKAFLRQVPTHPNMLFFNHYNTGITRIDFIESYGTEIDHLRLHYLNRVDHLPPELRTW